MRVLRGLFDIYAVKHEVYVLTTKSRDPDPNTGE